MADPSPPPTAPRPRRRWRRRLLFAFVLSLLAVALLPYAIALGPVRGFVAARAAAQLGAPCRIDALAWSWTDGVTATGIEIGNPPGFPSERPCLRVRSATADALRGLSLQPTARIDGLELFVEQRADGSTNVQQLGRGGAGDGRPGSENPPAGGDGGAARALPPFDVTLTGGRIEFRRDGALLETATDVQVHAARASGASGTDVTAAASVAAGRTTLRLAHGDDGSTRAELDTPGLDLARWAPLVDVFAPGRLTALAGTAAGALTANLGRDGTIALGGELTVTAPRLGGPLLDGMTLGGERWTLRPHVALGEGTVDVRDLAVDLGWCTLRGLAPDAARPATAALRLDLDVAALAEFGGPMPTWLRGTGTRLGGELRVPTSALPTDAAGWSRALVAALQLDVPRLAVAGFTFTDVTANGTLQDGAFALTTADRARLDGGPIALTAQVDLTAPTRLPLRASVRWQGGQLHAATSQVLRYAVPLLAGVPDTAGTLSGLCDLELQVEGPALRADRQGWLAWLDLWNGSGSVGLRDAAFAPAPALQPLLTPLGALTAGATPLGDRGRLAIDSFSAPFAFAQGAVRSTASSWLAKGKRIGLSGSVGFDGGLAYELDLTALLQGHRDGEKVLAALSGRLPPAQLGGTLDAPQLALPEVQGVLQRVLEEELKKQGKGLLDRALDDLRKRR